MSEQTRPQNLDCGAGARSAAFQSGLTDGERALLDGAHRDASESLAELGRPERAVRAAERVSAAAEKLSRRHLSVAPSIASVACRAGCHWCCHLKVSLTAPEVFAIAQYLLERAPGEQLTRARARAAELARDPRIFCSEAKAEARIPCALLSEHGECTVHAVRPLSCRGYTSVDAEVCRRMLDDDSQFVVMNEALARETAALGLGLLAGIGEAGLAHELLELTSALHIALNDPQAMSRWLMGEAIFSSAQGER